MHLSEERDRQKTLHSEIQAKEDENAANRAAVGHRGTEVNNLRNSITNIEATLNEMKSATANKYAGLGRDIPRVYDVISKQQWVGPRSPALIGLHVEVRLNVIHLIG